MLFDLKRSPAQDFIRRTLIIGYHIPRSQNQSKREFISGKFDLGPDYGQNGNASKYPVDHEFLVYSRVLIQNDVIKQKLPAFQDSSINRDDYLVSKNQNIRGWLSMSIYPNFTFISS